jgi:RNA polymerase sigma-70 factor (ECF subfamily)
MQPESTSQRPSLECFRSYIVLLSRWYWNPRLQGKLDPSDIVQQTLIQAWQGLDEFRGETNVEFRAWLRRILTRCQADFVRGFTRDKRALARECSLDAMVADSSVRLEAWLDDRHRRNVPSATNNLYNLPMHWRCCLRRNKRPS